MKKTSRIFLFGALILVLLTAACAAEEGTPTTSYPGPSTPAGGDMTSTPLGGPDTTGTAETPAADLETATATQTTPDADVTRTPVVPVTGVDVVLVECQFCVDTRAHALLVLPDTATFQVVSPAPSTTTSTTADTDFNCSTVEVNNGKQVVLCSGPEMTPLVVNICTDANTCTDFPIDLLACPLTQGPSQTQSAPGVGGTETTTPTSSVVISTATSAGATATSTPTP